MRLLRYLPCSLLFLSPSCGTIATSAPATAIRPLDVRLEPDESDAALAILRLRLRDQEPAPGDWQKLFSSSGYQHLKEREAAMGRAFTDSSFRAFMMSDTLLQRATALDRSVQSVRHVGVAAAANRALRYLPNGTTLRARLYLEIKPRTNSFVFTGRDSVPGIFLYVNPVQSPAQLENTIAHELHHIGVAAACADRDFPNATPAQRMLLTYLGAFSEGQAMLAAAGSPSVHPHATDDDSIKARWDRDVAHATSDIGELSRFFASVLDGSITSADSVQSRAFSYYGTQGPWYTVGWLMASTIERELGRSRLVQSLCEPTQFISLYNDAAQRSAARGQPLPLWSSELVGRLIALRRTAD